jgi:FkbM family methyltransferase
MSRDQILGILGKALPEGRFKEILWNILKEFNLRYNNSLYKLNKLIKRYRLLSDGIILLELNNGLKFYGQPNERQRGIYGVDTETYEYKYGDPRKLSKLKEINPKYFGDFFSILRTIFVENAYERHYKLRKGDIVVDLGANVGVFTINAAKKVGDAGKVIAIEPEKNNLEFLRKNIELNKLKNVAIVPKGVWSKKGIMNLYLGPASGWHSLIFRRDKFTQIEVDTLDHKLEGLNIAKVDFIKMDIEGAEIEALKGMEDTLKTDKIRLAIEAFHKVKGKATAEIIAPSLKRKGFKIYEENGFVYAEKIS